MKKRNRRLILLGIFIILAVVVFSFGRKYLPFSKIVKMPSEPEQAFTSPQKSRPLPPHTLYYDFEVPAGKEMPSGFKKGVAHSGQYAVKAFGQNSFSVVVEKTAGEIGVENLKAVAMSAWLYVFPTKSEVKGSLVFTASNEVGVNVCWKGLGVREPEIPRGKWFKISTYFDLTGIEFKPGYKLQFYFWNTSPTDILVDDYFVSFGGAVDRRGDSARVDMTRPGGYVPKFNYPPFRTAFLEKSALAKTIPPSAIGEDDLAVAGDFFGNGFDGVVLVHKDGKTELYAFCPATREFNRITLANPAAAAAIAPVTQVLKGSFTGDKGEQLLISGAKGWILLSAAHTQDPCKSATGSTTLKAIGGNGSACASIAAGDFNGDRRKEVLTIAANGSWKVLGLTGTPGAGVWKTLASGETPPDGTWSTGMKDVSVTAGSFTNGASADVILTVSGRNAKPGGGWSLLRLNTASGKWVSCLAGNREGKTIGPDTLKPADRFFVMTGEGGKRHIYRYNRDWRFDLKEIAFNDSTFEILSWVDFHGYADDRNPKYYESLTLLPGCFNDRNISSFLAAGRVQRSRGYQSILPDFTDLYTLPAHD